MTKQEDLVSIGYFGKLPTRDDFVKATDNANLISIVDGWLTNAMDLLATNPHWKTIYDNVMPMHFAVTATRTPRAVAGHLIASRDQAARRFPFICLGALQISRPEEFLAYSPLVLGSLWSRLESQTNLVMQAEDANEPLRQLCASDLLLDIGTQSYHAAFGEFLDRQTIGTLTGMLADGAYSGDLRQLILALGMLLHPVMASGTSRLDKSLILPLPSDSQQRYSVAAFWMHLVSPFLLKANFELAMIFTCINHKDVMIIGFDGASPRTLQVVMSPNDDQGHFIWFDDTQWVETSASQDYRLEKLSSYLLQPALQLSTAFSYFKEIFLG